MHQVALRASLLSALFHLVAEPAIAQFCATCNGGAYYRHLGVFGARAPCALYNIQAEVDIMAAANSSARWSNGGCANAARPAGLVGIASAASFLTGLSGVNDFMVVANDTCRHLRLANNSAFENAGNICFDLTPTAGTQVNRMTLWPDGKIDFNVGNWNCQKGMIRFEGESWDASSPNVDDPVMKLYRPTGADGTCPNPSSYTWWIQNAGSSGGDNSGSLQFRALPTFGTIGTETVSTMQTRVTFQRNGNVGINTLTPVARLQVKDGSVLFDGYTGSTPISGGGPRLMWVPEKSAFRAGVAGTTSWDDSNIGTNSWAGGAGTKASGSGSFAMGNGSIVAGDFSAGFGNSTTANTASYSLAFGTNTTIDGPFSFCGGFYCKTYSSFDFSVGKSNESGVSGASEIHSHGNVAMGHSCIAQGLDCFALGWGSQSGQADIQTSFAIGISAYAFERGSFALGENVTINTGGSNSFVIGTGIDATNKLINATPNVIKMGTLTDKSTFTVVPKSTSTGPCGNVGIGEDSPKNRLEVSGGLVVGSGYAGSITSSIANNKAYIEGGVVIGINTAQTDMLYVNGSTYCTTAWTACDSSLKRDIQPYLTGLSAVRKINTISFKYKPELTQDSIHTHLGVIAQDLQKVIPTAVRNDTLRHEKILNEPVVSVDTVRDKEDSSHYRLKYNYGPMNIDTTYTRRLSVNSNDVLYTVVNAVKELDLMVDSTRNTLVEFRNLIADQHASIDSLKVENRKLQLSVLDLMTKLQGVSTGNDSFEPSVLLEQNRPNPFHGTTEIAYWLDSSYDEDVYLEITHLASTEVVQSIPAQKGVAVTEKIDATGWKNGVYLYCLRSNGRVLACKKMLITN